MTLLNFMITPEGLQDQLLGIVVAKERPELQKEKELLILEAADNKRQLKEIEDKILKVLTLALNLALTLAPSLTLTLTLARARALALTLTKVLSESEGNILEDQTAIDILSASKRLSDEIAQKQDIAEQTTARLDRRGEP